MSDRWYLLICGSGLNSDFLTFVCFEIGYFPSLFILISLYYPGPGPGSCKIWLATKNNGTPKRLIRKITLISVCFHTKWIWFFDIIFIYLITAYSRILISFLLKIIIFFSYAKRDSFILILICIKVRFNIILNWGLINIFIILIQINSISNTKSCTSLWFLIR